jgi:hypothetical protein
MATGSREEAPTDVIVRPAVFTLGLALGAAAQALAQLATPSPAPLPPATSAPSETPSALPSESPSPVATPTSLPTITPSPTPTPLFTITPLFSPTPTPTPTPAATPYNPYKYVVEPTPDPNASPGAPQIVRIEINDKIVHVGQQFACRITTTPNVSSVILTVEGRDIQIPKAQDGLFAGIQKIPAYIPPWFLKTYQVTFNALTPDGQKTSTTLPVTLAY